MSSELFRIVDTLSLDSDTVALSARQGKILNEKIQALSLFSVSDGIIPIGGVVGVLGVFSGPNNTGVFISAPTTNSNIVVPGAITVNGFQFCNGNKVATGANSTFANNYVPNLTDNRFLKGSTASGLISSVNGQNQGDNTVKLVTANLPPHNHTITTTIAQGGAHDVSVSGTTSSVGNHNHSGLNPAGFQGSYTTFSGGHVHQYYKVESRLAEVEGAFQGQAWVSTNDRVVTDTMGSGEHWHGVVVAADGGHNHTVTSTGTVGTHNHIATSTSELTGEATVFDIQPKFLTVNYYMRVR